MKLRSLLLGVAAASLVAGTAAADIIVDVDPPFPPNPDENVLLTTDVAGNPIFGVTNQTDSVVVFTSDEDLVAPPEGQARIVAVDDSLTFLRGELQNPLLGFSEIEFNINALADGSALVQFFDFGGGTFGGEFDLGGAGSNFFTAVAINGQLISHFTITALGDTVIEDVAQIRLGGVTAIPEPGTWLMMILGFGMVGAGLRTMRRRNGTALSVA